MAAAPPSNALLQAITQGTVFLAGSGNVTLSVAGNFRLALANPAGSGKLLHVFGLDTYGSASAMAELLIGTPLTALTGVPVAVRNSNNTYIGSPGASAGLVTADTSATTALAGGVDSGVSIALPGGVVTKYLRDQPEMKIPAGFTLGFNVAFTGAANASVNIFWFET